LLLTFLRNTGRSHITMDYIRSLPANSDERKGLEAARIEYAAVEEKLRLERAAKREQEEAARRKIIEVTYSITYLHTIDLAFFDDDKLLGR
jgi:hypothetical protein